MGPGVVAFGAAAVLGTRDPNRGGKPRVDFVIYHVDGAFWRIHPGSQPTGDAIPKYFPPPGGPPVPPANWWQLLPPEGFHYGHARSVPQTDRLSKKMAWAELGQCADGYLDDSPTATFKWWLWLCNLGTVTREVLGAGVVRAYLRHHAHDEKHVICTRSDDSEVTIQFTMHAPGNPRIAVLRE